MSGPADILAQILARKAEEVAERKAATPLAAIRKRAAESAPGAGFHLALQRAIQQGRAAVIA